MPADASGRRARWTAVVLVAPSAAAVFGAMTAWAVRTPVATASPTPKAKSAATTDPALLKARAAADRSARQLSALQRQVTQLRARLREVQAAAAIAGGTNQPVTSVPTDDAQSSAYVPADPVTVTTARSSVTTSTYVAPPAVRTTAAPAPVTSSPPPQTTSAAPPPPPVQTTSSGSRP